MKTRSVNVRFLLISRHAHRYKPMGGRLDNGLSPRGRAQAIEFARRFVARDILSDIRGASLLSSPKRRCLQTLEPLARVLKADITVEPLLDEGEAEERVKKFFAQWQVEKSRLTIVNTHGDWIPEFFKFLFGAKIDLKKGGWALVEVRGSQIEAKIAASLKSLS